MAQDGVRELILSFLTEDGEVDDIDSELNLFDAGIVDSFKMVQLVLYLESQLDVTIDLFVVDPASFFTVSGLCALFDRESDSAVKT